MPFSSAEKQTAITPCFAQARKPLADYIRLVSIDALYTIYTAPFGPARLTSLVRGFFPDQLRSLQRDLTGPELLALGAMNLNTLQSLGQMTPGWVKAMLRTITGTLIVNFHTWPLPPGVVVVLNANHALDQTSTQPGLPSSIVTELNGAGAAVRNLIFNAAGNCVGEINFANHGGTAVSGHAHVYPITCVPLTGHHAMGTPHIDMADYPAIWRQLPAGVAPATALGL